MGDLFNVTDLNSSYLYRYNKYINADGSYNEDGEVLYKLIFIVLGVLVFVTNMPVVISSGVLLRKDPPHPKTTFLLLGNVSLADTFVGIGLIFGTMFDTKTSDFACSIIVGTIVTLNTVSMLSVGLIAVDRYLYIIHGLYYHRWVSTGRVRVCVLLIWTFGFIVGSLPSTGWTNQDFRTENCSYMTLLPEGQLILNALLTLIPMIIVLILYVKILIEALRKKQHMMSPQRYANFVSNKLIFNKTHHAHKLPNPESLKKSASTGDLQTAHKKNKKVDVVVRCTSMDLLENQSKYVARDFDSYIDIQIISLDSKCNSTANISSPRSRKVSTVKKNKDRGMFRAVSIVMVTSGSFIVTWFPFCLILFFYIACEDKVNEPQCVQLRNLLIGPLPILAFCNCILNPIIYAWFHKGFKAALNKFIRRYCRKINVDLFNRNKPSNDRNVKSSKHYLQSIDGHI